MKILQINKFFFLKGGSERCFFDLSELLSKKGHQVYTWSTKYYKNFPWPDDNLFAEYSDFSKKEGFKKDLKKVLRIFWNREANKKLKKIIKQENPDIAHLHNIFSHLSPSIIYTLKKNNIPIIMTLHDYKLFCPNYKLFSKNELCFDCLKKNNFRSCFKKRCIKNSWIKSFIGYLEAKWQKDFLKITDKIDIFITPSLFIKRQSIRSGIPAEKVVYLPHFIDKDFSNIKSNNSQKYILYFGRLSKEKGVNLLIQSYIKNYSKLFNWKIKILGDGPELEKLKELASEYSQIEFLGKKKGRELKEIISKAYLIVVPSLWPENLPYTILESFILKKVVLAAKIGGISEMIKENETGLLFKLNDLNDLTKKINWAINNPKKIKEMGKKAKENILEKYDPEKYYNKLIKIYERVQNKSKSN